MSRPLAWATLIAGVCLTALLFGGVRGDPATAETADKSAYAYRQGWLKRGRIIRHQRYVFRRSLGTSPLGNHWLEDAFNCIHRYEGGWGAATGNGYYGGLQMDWSFMRAYGPEYLRAIGTANHWPRSVQIAVGIKGYLARGFSPWPTTRRSCGL